MRDLYTEIIAEKPNQPASKPQTLKETGVTEVIVEDI